MYVVTLRRVWFFAFSVALEVMRSCRCLCYKMRYCYSAMLLLVTVFLWRMYWYVYVDFAPRQNIS